MITRTFNVHPKYPPPGENEKGPPSVALGAPNERYTWFFNIVKSKKRFAKTKKRIPEVSKSFFRLYFRKNSKKIFIGDEIRTFKNFQKKLKQFQKQLDIGFLTLRR
jgi:hypothetical protein